jgi:predicted lactoylglutathione lyase
MIGYVTLGTNDLQRAARFYDQLTAVMGAKRGWQSEKYIGWLTSENAPMLMLIKPHDGKAATAGNGTMVALAASSKEQVGQIHKKALELGGQDEGAVGPRGDGFYGGYFRDLDGNKLCAYFLG